MQTREWIIGAFNHLLLTRGYVGIRTADIIRRAGVGKSTFYEHFHSKEDVLRTSVAFLLEVFVDAAMGSADIGRLIWTLDHFWENQATARALLGAAAGSPVTNVLTGLLVERLSTLTADGGVRVRLPVPLAAGMIAKAQMALVEDWIRGVAPCNSAALADALRSASAGMMRGLVVGA